MRYAGDQPPKDGLAWRRTPLLHTQSMHHPTELSGGHWCSACLHLRRGAGQGSPCFSDRPILTTKPQPKHADMARTAGQQCSSRMQGKQGNGTVHDCFWVCGGHACGTSCFASERVNIISKRPTYNQPSSLCGQRRHQSKIAKRREEAFRSRACA